MTAPRTASFRIANIKAACTTCGGDVADETNDMVYCDHCDSCFHQKCHPGLDPLPPDDEAWFCAPCDQARDLGIELWDEYEDGRRAVPEFSESAPFSDDVKEMYQVVKKTTGMIGGNANGGPIYGEITYVSFQRVINALKTLCHMDHNSCFIDIGAGLGKPSFHATLTGVKLSFGLELDQLRWQLSMSNVRNLMMTHPRFVSFRRGETIDAMEPFKALRAAPASPKKNFFGVARRNYDARRGTTTTPPPRASPSPDDTITIHTSLSSLDRDTPVHSNGNGNSKSTSTRSKKAKSNTVNNDDSDTSDDESFTALYSRDDARTGGKRAKKAAAREAKWMTESVNWQPNTFLALADVNDLSSLDPFTHIYMFDVGFPVLTMGRLAVIFNQSTTPMYLICYHKPRDVIREYSFVVDHIGMIRVTMMGSHEGHTAYVYRRRAHHPRPASSSSSLSSSSTHIAGALGAADKPRKEKKTSTKSTAIASTPTPSPLSSPISSLLSSGWVSPKRSRPDGYKKAGNRQLQLSALSALAGSSISMIGRHIAEQKALATPAVATITTGRSLMPPVPAPVPTVVTPVMSATSVTTTTVASGSVSIQPVTSAFTSLSKEAKVPSRQPHVNDRVIILATTSIATIYHNTTGTIIALPAAFPTVSSPLGTYTVLLYDKQVAQLKASSFRLSTSISSLAIPSSPLVKPIPIMPRTPERKGSKPKVVMVNGTHVGALASSSSTSSFASSLSLIPTNNNNNNDHSMVRPSAIAPPYTFFCPFTSTMPPAFVAEKAEPLIPVVASTHHQQTSRSSPRRTRTRANTHTEDNTDGKTSNNSKNEVQHISLDNNPRRGGAGGGGGKRRSKTDDDSLDNIDHGGEASLTLLATPGRTRVASRRDTFVAPRAVQDAFGLPSTVRLSRMALDALSVLSYGLPYYRQFITRQLESYHNVSGPLRARAHRSSRHRGPASPQRNRSNNSMDNSNGNHDDDHGTGGLASAAAPRRRTRGSKATAAAVSSSSSSASEDDDDDDDDDSDEEGDASSDGDNDDDDGEGDNDDNDEEDDEENDDDDGEGDGDGDNDDDDEPAMSNKVSSIRGRARGRTPSKRTVRVHQSVSRSNDDTDKKAIHARVGARVSKKGSGTKRKTATKSSSLSLPNKRSLTSSRVAGRRTSKSHDNDSDSDSDTTGVSSPPRLRRRTRMPGSDTD